MRTSSEPVPKQSYEICHSSFSLLKPEYHLRWEFCCEKYLDWSSPETPAPFEQHVNSDENPTFRTYQINRSLDLQNRVFNFMVVYPNFSIRFSALQCYVLKTALALACEIQFLRRLRPFSHQPYLSSSSSWSLSCITE